MLEPAPPAVPALRLRVLVVDEHRDAADSLVELLSILGADARACYTGPAALAAAAEFRPDAGVFEAHLRGVDGYELARRVRAAAGPRPLYLAAVTVLGGAAAARRSAEAGFDLHLLKPADPAELFAALAAFDRTLRPRTENDEAHPWIRVGFWLWWGREKDCRGRGSLGLQDDLKPNPGRVPKANRNRWLKCVPAPQASRDESPTGATRANWASGWRCRMPKHEECRSQRNRARFTEPAFSPVTYVESGIRPGSRGTRGGCRKVRQPERHRRKNRRGGV